MNGYIGFFNGREVALQAPTAYAAQQAAIAHFQPRKAQRHMVHVVLAEKDGAPVVHNTAAI